MIKKYFLLFLRAPLVAAFLLLTSLPVQAGFDDAIALYREQKYEDARAAFEALSAIGVRTALFNLAVMYYRGEATEPDAVKAYVMMRLANADFNDEDWSRVAGAIYATFSDEQKQQAEQRFPQLKAEFDIAAARARVQPKLLSDADCPPEPQALIKVAPRYPRSELARSRMGITILEYTVSPEGYVRDLAVDGSSSEAFAKVSLASALKFLYQPPANGRPVFGHRNKFVFSIEGGLAVSRTIRDDLLELESQAKTGDPVAQYKYARNLSVYRDFQQQLRNVDLQHRTSNEWYLKSAEGGLAVSQFEVGRNMIEGRGCEVDIQSGMKWIAAAANSGYSPAQRMMGQSIFATQEALDRGRALAAISWLRNASMAGDDVATVWLAWELATSPVAELRDGAAALDLVRSEFSNYFDEVRLLETEAAAYAELGEFRKAAKLQRKALKQAKDNDWTIPLISERLAVYEHHEAFTGAYY